MKKKKPASALIITMVILGVIMVIALSASLASVQERKSSIGESKSSLAYQFADSGVEYVKQKIKSYPTGTIANIDIDGNCNGVITTNGYVVELRDSTKAIITDCNEKVSKIDTIKSIGTAEQDKRAIIASVNTCSDPTDGLIGYWNMEEGRNGNVARDTHSGPPDPQDANITGASWGTGKIGGDALYFDETNNDIAETPDRTDSTSGPYILNKGTISAWINVDDILAANKNYWMGWKQTIASWGSSQTGFSFMQWGLKYYPDYPDTGRGDAYPARIFIEWKAPCSTGGDPHAYLETRDLVDMRDGGWHLATFIANGDDPVKIYWDKKEIKDLNFYQDDCNGAAGNAHANDFMADVRDVGAFLWGYYPNNHSFSIGGCPHCAGASQQDSYNGAVDDVRIYNKDLKACEIEQL